MAGGPGFEPRLTESESAVLPLNYPPTNRPETTATGWLSRTRRLDFWAREVNASWEHARSRQTVSRMSTAECVGGGRGTAVEAIEKRDRLGIMTDRAGGERFVVP